MKFSGIKSLRFLLIVNLIFGAALLRTVRQYNDFVHSSEEKEKEKVVALTKKAAQELGAIVAHVEERTKKMAAAFSKNSTPPVSDIKKQLAAELDSNEIFLGSGVLYAPYAYSKKFIYLGHIFIDLESHTSLQMQEWFMIIRLILKNLNFFIMLLVRIKRLGQSRFGEKRAKS